MSAGCVRYDKNPQWKKFGLGQIQMFIEPWDGQNRYTIQFSPLIGRHEL